MKNIRDMEKFIASLPDWSALNECFGGKVRVSDIDGIVERNGHFLVLETKHQSECSMPVGQDLMFRALSNIKEFTVAIIRGPIGGEHGLEIRRGGQSVELRSNLQTLSRFATRWDECARSRDFSSLDERLAKLLSPIGG